MAPVGMRPASASTVSSPVPAWPRGGKSDEIIRAGAVQVNGEVAASPGRTVSVDDDVRVDGNRVHLPDSFEYILLNKPSGLIVTRSDPGGRATVFDRIPDLRGASVSVGRLDRDTTGVLLLTDDGQLAYRLAHPRFEVEKRYEAVVKGRPAAAAVRRLGEGVDLDDGPTAQAQVRILSGRRAPAGDSRCRRRRRGSRSACTRVATAR